jgi:hypothetical protein
MIHTITKQREVIRKMAEREVKNLIEVRGVEETRLHISSLQRISKKGNPNWLLAEWMEYYLLEWEMIEALGL